MHRLHHAQRRHITTSLEALLYQLHILSFFMSPSLLVLIPRITSQFQFSRPREIDSKRTLRFWFLMVLVFNFGALWTHASDGAATGPAIIIDFIGMAYVPSKLQLVSLDIIIVFLELVLTTIAYETSLAAAMSAAESTDPLMYIPNSPDPTNKTQASNSLPYYALDLQIRHVIKRIRGPPPPIPRAADRDELLPLPATVPTELRESLRMLLRARADMRARNNQPATTQPRVAEGASNRVPGAMDNE